MASYELPSKTAASVVEPEHLSYSADHHQRCRSEFLAKHGVAHWSTLSKDALMAYKAKCTPGLPAIPTVQPYTETKGEPTLAGDKQNDGPIVDPLDITPPMPTDGELIEVAP